MRGPLLVLVPTAPEAQALFGASAPRDEEPRPSPLGGGAVLAALCGFGPAAAGALAAHALARSGARACLLAGLAGTYRPDVFPVGTAVAATEVRAEVGRGRGASFRSSSALGFPQAPPLEGSAAVGDALATSLPGALLRGAAPCRVGTLLTVACASGSAEEARERALRDASVLGEEMEGFAVALACRRRGVPVVVLRGASNVAGVADRAAWRVEEAMEAVAVTLRRAVEALS